MGWFLICGKSHSCQYAKSRHTSRLQNVFECGQMYVALSRCRSLEGLALRDVDWSKCRAHPKVLAWHQQLQLQAAADTPLPQDEF